jgi:hypothetical protein
LTPQKRHKVRLAGNPIFINEAERARHPKSVAPCESAPLKKWTKPKYRKIAYKTNKIKMTKKTRRSSGR